MNPSSQVAFAYTPCVANARPDEEEGEAVVICVPSCQQVIVEFKD
jgi:hypothetical protein